MTENSKDTPRPAPAGPAVVDDVTRPRVMAAVDNGQVSGEVSRRAPRPELSPPPRTRDDGAPAHRPIPAPVRVIPAALGAPPKPRRSGVATVLTVGLFGLLALLAAAVFVLLPRWVADPNAGAATAAAAATSETAEGSEDTAATVPVVTTDAAAPVASATPAPPSAAAAAGGLAGRDSDPSADDTFRGPATATGPAAPSSGGGRVQALLADAEDAAARREWAAAEDLYRRVLRASPGNPKAQRGLLAAQEAVEEATFQAAMTRILAALDAGAWADARAALGAAEMHRAGAPQLADIRRRLELAERQAALDDHARTAAAAAGQEDWHAAKAAYRAMLTVDPLLRTAQEGLAKSTDLAALHDEIAGHLASPQRLSDPAVLDEAMVALSRARESADPGPRLQARTIALDAVITGYAEPVAAALTSDAATEVTIYRVGELGRFSERQLQLRPGVYTVVGSRPGYRDVRLEWTIEPGAAPAPLDVRCREQL